MRDFGDAEAAVQVMTWQTDKLVREGDAPAAQAAHDPEMSAVLDALKAMSAALHSEPLRSRHRTGFGHLVRTNREGLLQRDRSLPQSARPTQKSETDVMDRAYRARTRAIASRPLGDRTSSALVLSRSLAYLRRSIAADETMSL